MPKINVYVPDDMLAWIRDNDVKPSAEFQARIKELQGSGAAETGSSRRRLRRVLVKNGRVRMSPDVEALGVEESGGNTYILYLE